MKRLIVARRLRRLRPTAQAQMTDLPMTPTTSATRRGCRRRRHKRRRRRRRAACARTTRACRCRRTRRRARAAARAARAARTSERQGLILGDGDGSYDYEGGSVSVAPGGQPAEVPETHVVQKGDTLWDLSSRYYRNAWGWPKMWSYNPQITNPHWIYPGDTLRILPPGGASGAGARRRRKPRRCRPRASSDAASGRTASSLRQTGFVEPGELAQAGKIVGSKEEKLMLGTLDEAYVEYHRRSQPFQVGERYTVYKPTRAVKHPLTRQAPRPHGRDLRRGRGPRRHRRQDRARRARRLAQPDRARLPRRAAQAPVQGRAAGRRQGGHAGPGRRHLAPARARRRPTTSSSSIAARTTASSSATASWSPAAATAISRCSSKGPIDDRRFPRETIGEIVVVDLRDHLATGVVTYSTVESRVGDRVEARRGF